MNRWQRGDHIVVRNVWHDRVFGAIAAIVVEDEPEQLVAWIPPGSERKLPPGRHQPWDRGWQHADRPWHSAGVLVVKEPDAPYSIWHFRDPDDSFAGWYGNLELPARRTRFGYDTRDHILDLWRPSDGDWRWKDEDEFEAAIAHGLFADDEAAAIRAAGERVISDVRIPTGWEEWEPDPLWRTPRLPADWHVV